MAMDKDRLGNAIVDIILTCNPITATAADQTTLRKYWKAIANEIIEEIKANMEVSTVVSIPNAQAGATTLPGTGQETLVE